MIVIPGIIPIRIQPIFWALILLLGFSYSGDLAITLWFGLIATVSILVHEYGHALTALAFGQQADIELVALGGLTHYRGPRLKMWQEFLITLNGPLAGLSLALVAYLILIYVVIPYRAPLPYMILSMTVNINIFWTLFNLLPIHPLDGGKLCSFLLQRIAGLKGLKASYFISMLLAGLLGAYCLYLNQLYSGAILLMFMFENYRSWNSSLQLSVYDTSHTLQHSFQEAERCLQLGNQAEAWQQFSQIRKVSNKGVLYRESTQYLAQILVQRGQYEEANQLLAPLEKKLNFKGLEVLQQSYFRQKNYAKALELGMRAHQMQPHWQMALNNAFCHALLREVKPTVGWLQCAIREGLPAKTTVMKRVEFDLIRHEVTFRKLAERD